MPRSLPLCRLVLQTEIFLREAGVPVYGISGMFGDIIDITAHGRNERFGIKEFYDSVEFMYKFVRLFAQ